MVGRKTGGRTTGTPNKFTAEFKAHLRTIVSDYFNGEVFSADLSKLTADKRVQTMTALLKHFFPIDTAEFNEETILQPPVIMMHCPKCDANK